MTAASKFLRILPRGWRSFACTGGTAAGESSKKMTPYELATAFHRELSPVAPRLSAALNRALVDIGEGSMLVLPSEPADVTFQETESVPEAESHGILSKIFAVLPLLAQHSRWRVDVERRRGEAPGQLRLVYTLYRETKPCW